MSIICWKDGVLASDSQVSGDTIIGSVIKIISNKHGLFGMVGSLGAGVAARNFIISCFNNDECIIAPNFMDNEKYTVIHINLNNEVNVYQNTLSNYSTIDADYFSFGSGDILAAGAMEHGASAIEAVKIAIKLDPFCGGVVQQLTLEDCNE
ncbi:MAG: hypothetical protein COA63_014285 [Methylophaga sp.]|nr:hypothetical protein [Methylophaga sp.]